LTELCTRSSPSIKAITNIFRSPGSQWATYVLYSSPSHRPLTPYFPSNSAHLQILFLIGLTIIIGPQKTLLFFARRQKLKGTAAFFGGLALILMRWALIGFLVELYGIFILFGDFLGTIAGFARNIPVVGQYIGMAVDRAGVSVRGAELPV
jgi:hypothetical protein